MKFQFENLDIYQKSLDWVENVDSLCKALKKQVSYSFLDQLSRASLSIPLNIAEGNGRWHRGEKIQFLRIARGSVFECVPLIQILHRRKLISEEQYQRLYEDLVALAQMSAKLMKAYENLK